MRPRSAAFDRVVRSSHRMLSTVDVLYDRQPIATDLAVVAGTVTLDRNARIMGSIDVALAEPVLVSQSAGLLTPYGYELRVRRGIDYGGARDIELLDLGIFPIQQSQFDGVTLTVRLMANDRSQLVTDARLEDDYAIAAGTNYATAIRALIEQGVPGLTYVLTPTTFTTPDLVFAQGSDRWEAAQQMAEAIGMELYFDGLGRCVMRPEPTINSAAVQWSVDEGAGGVLVGASLTLDRQNAYNKVVVSGENTSLGQVFRGEAADLNPLSPTYYLGGFGRKPMFHASPLYTSNVQCAAAAAGMLTRRTGVARSISLTTVTQPALEPGDAIMVTRAELGIAAEVHLIDRISIGLSATDQMTLDTRTVR